jgi:hypothetical protein
MYKYILFLILTLVLFACDSSNSVENIEGSYSDASGLSILTIKKIDSLHYSIGFGQSSLQATRNNNTLHGLRMMTPQELQRHKKSPQPLDSFHMEFLGDSAIYSIMGIATPFYPKQSSANKK